MPEFGERESQGGANSRDEIFLQAHRIEELNSLKGMEGCWRESSRESEGGAFGEVDRQGWDFHGVVEKWRRVPTGERKVECPSEFQNRGRSDDTREGGVVRGSRRGRGNSVFVGKMGRFVGGRSENVDDSGWWEKLG